MNYVLAFVGGFIVAFLMLSALSDDTVSLKQCRAANPGFDCDLGWVRGEAY